MSTLAVNSITDANGGNTATINSMTPTADSLQGFRNRIINGDMRIDQRNAGAAVTTSDSYPVDRFRISIDTDGAFSAQQDSPAPAGFVNSLKFTTTTADGTLGATQYAAVIQNIEGLNVADLGWGTANAKTVTLSFWVRGSLTGTFGGVVKNSASNRSYPFTYSISVADTWEYKTVTIAGDTSGTWLTTNGIGLRLSFGLGVGSTFSGTAGSWAGANYISATGAVSVIGTLNATWQITGVQLEVGSVATPFERRPFGTELSLCQRYLFVVKGSEHSDNYCRFIQGDIESGTNFTSGYTLPVRMRVTPTMTTTGTASNYAIYSGGVITACSVAPNIASGNPQTVCVVASVASGLTAGRGATLLANNNNTAYLYYGAEL